MFVNQDSQLHCTFYYNRSSWDCLAEMRLMILRVEDKTDCSLSHKTRDSEQTPDQVTACVSLRLRGGKVCEKMGLFNLSSVVFKGCVWTTGQQVGECGQCGPDGHPGPQTRYRMQSLETVAAAARLATPLLPRDRRSKAIKTKAVGQPFTST